MSKKIKHWFLITGLLAILNFGLISTPLQAATYTVCPVGCNYTTISAAITNAVSGDVIFVGPGTYNGNITIDRNIQVVGAGTGSTIIHGDNTASVVTINAGVVVTITGVTIENGAGNITLPVSAPANATDKSGRRVGGGVDNKGTLTLSHSLVQDNTVNGEDSSGRYSALGGGIFNETAASLSISYSTVLNNRANGGRGIRGGGGGGGFGGGIYNTSGATLLIHNSAIISNIAQGGASNLSNGTGGGGAGLGGGLFSEGVLTVTNSTFSNNRAIGGNGISGTSFSTAVVGGGGFGGSAYGGTGGFGGGGGGNTVYQGNGGSGGFGGGGGASGYSTGGKSGNGGIGGGGAGHSYSGGGSGGFGGGYGQFGGGGGAGIGGGLFIMGTASMADSTIASNNAIGGDGNRTYSLGGQGGGGFGGGIFSNGSIVTLDNSILTGNETMSGVSMPSPVTSVGPNCVVGNGTDGSTTGGSFIGNNNLESGTDCNITGISNQQNGIANLGSLSNNGGPTQTHMPGAGQARDTGSGCASLDQRDVSRPQPQGGTCDKGAVEATTTTNAPVVTLPLGTRDYMLGAGAIILEPGATVGDSDSSDFQRLVVNFSAGNVPGQDKLGVQDQGTGTGQIALRAIAGVNYVYYQGVIIGTYTTSDSAINFTFNPNDTTVAIQTLIRLITFENTSSTPSAGTRTVAFALTDAHGNTSTATTNIIVKVADLHITKSVSPTTPVLPGTPITYTLTFSNVGNSTATGVIITDGIPVSVTNTSVISNGPAITNTGYTPAYAWRVQDLIPYQKGIITITGLVSDSLTAGVFTNTATITGTTADRDTTNNRSEVGLTVISSAALAITKTVATANNPIQPGDAITYTIVVANSGGSDAMGVRITDTLPAYVNGSELDEIVSVTANEQIMFTINATLDDEAPYGAIITNTAYYSHTSGGGKDTANLIVAGSPQLAITKTVELSNTPPKPGDPLTYTIVVANNGASKAIGVVISDTLPAYIIGADLYQIINIAVGESLTFTFTASLDDDVPFGETITNTVSFSHTSGSGQDSNVFSVKEAKENYLPIILKD